MKVKDEKEEDEPKEKEEDPEVLKRTIHFKGFNLEDTEDKIREFVAKYGEVENLELLKLKNEPEKHRVSHQFLL